MAVILVTNDDGVHSQGIIALFRAMKELGDAYIVAPDRERSAVSHALTLHRPLRAEELSEHVYAVNGTPTDCVAIGVNKIPPEKPALIVSGINKGGNVGDDITYSGTVSAAIEGTIMGIPSFAVSIVGDKNSILIRRLTIPLKSQDMRLKNRFLTIPFLMSTCRM